MPKNNKLRPKKSNKVLGFFNPKTLRGGIALFVLVFVVAGAIILIYNSFAGTGGAGSFHTCWIKENDSNSLWCWGDNSRGQLGQGDTTPRLLPTEVKNISNVSRVSAGGAHTCAIKADNTLWCWGDNRKGQLGLGDTAISTCGSTSDPCAKGPRQVEVVDTNAPGNGTANLEFDLIAAGYEHTCARAAEGSLWCWGSNIRGQLGIGAETNQNTPQKLSLTGTQAVNAGAYHTCAIKNDTPNQPAAATAYCWGSNSFGQLGVGDTKITTCGTGINSGPCAKFPRLVVGSASGSNFTGAEKISAGAYHTCIVKTDDTVWCWGRNTYGQLGSGSTSNSKIPVKAKIDGVYQVASGQNHTCARKIASPFLLYCWGYNASGQLGTGNRANTSSPMQVPGFTTTYRVNAGTWDTCASKNDGSLWCWGDNSKGQLGIGNVLDKLSPTKLNFTWK